MKTILAMNGIVSLGVMQFLFGRPYGKDLSGWRKAGAVVY
jgi:hypothetical protein